MSLIILTAVWLQLSCDLPIHIYSKLPVSYCVKHRLFSYMYFFSTFRILLPGMLIAVPFVLSVFTTPTSFLEMLWCLEDLRLQLYFGTNETCFFPPFPFLSTNILFGIHVPLYTDHDIQLRPKTHLKWATFDW